MRKANLILGLVLAMAVKAHGEEIPTSFIHHYTPEVDIVLLPDQCDKADISQGWQAEARNLETKAHADGCWQYAKQGGTVIINLEIGEGKYIDYQLYLDKFSPVYGGAE